ncbi:MAG: two-component regulator propeller domain-containing protein [Syntrophothermus sp.]
MKLKYAATIAILWYFFPLYSSAQSFGIGEWRDQLPYYECISVIEAGNRIYSATPYSMFYVDKDDNSVYRLNKINGLSDIGISTTGYSKEWNTLVVAYSNANIDLIKGNRIINISDIKRASILGNKTINTIFFNGKYAYLGCGFGIVVLDVEKEEITDTYYIGNNGSQVNVLSITLGDNDTLYAGSDKGLYTASVQSPNLANYQSWKKDSRINMNGYYRCAVNFAGEVIVSMHRINQPDMDSLYRLKNNTWSTWVLNNHNPVMNLRSSYGYLLVVNDGFMVIYDQTFAAKSGSWGYPFGSAAPRDATMDASGICWIADGRWGLVKFDIPAGNTTRVDISGPLTASSYYMRAVKDHLFVVPGGRDVSYTPLWNQGQVYQFDNSNWIPLDVYTNGGTIGYAHDYVTVNADPSNVSKVYAGSWGSGLMEFENGMAVKRWGYTNTNGALGHHSGSDTGDVRIGGACFDADGNLWVVSSHTGDCIAKKTGDTWTGYTIPNDIDLGDVVIDNAGQKWIVMRYGTQNSFSILVFAEGASGNKYKRLNGMPGSGGLHGTAVTSMVVDKTGQVWVGTEKGIDVFYTPEDILTTSPSDAQQILVQQGTHTQYLMESESVTALAVDGANRKWIGTERGGVFLQSADGTKEIYHFTEENSPLFSNSIASLAVSPSTGEVFIGTDKGIISFRGTATEGGDTNTDVYAYPNPVRENFDGYIAIKGLVSNAEVRITDVSMNLVYSTRAEGGQAIWDGKNFHGEKAKSGVYLVFANNAEGNEKVVTKILIIN